MDRIDVGNSNEIGKEIIHAGERVVQDVITFLNEMVQNNRLRERQNRNNLEHRLNLNALGKSHNLE